VDVKAGDELVVEVQARTSSRVVDAPFILAYDANHVSFLGSSAGDFLGRDGTSLVFLANGQSHAGEVSVGIGRTDRRRGISGEGTLCTLRFAAAAPGEVSFQIRHAMAWGEAGAPLPIQSNSITVRIR
jgi:hypothetical protein